MIIFLNGASSSGKSTIIKALQHLYPKPLLAIGIDTFLQMMPPQYVGSGEKAKEGFQFVMDIDEEGPIIRVNSGEYGERIGSLALKVIELIADNDLDIISDQVLFEDEDLKRYVKLLHKYRVYFISIHCSLAEISEREILRGNRTLGLGRDQIHRVHGPTRIYDLELDTTKKSAFNCAKQIITYIKNVPEPKSFKKLYRSFYG